jgi:hypothetical protein
MTVNGLVVLELAAGGSPSTMSMAAEILEKCLWMARVAKTVPAMSARSPATKMGRLLTVVPVAVAETIEHATPGAMPPA